MDGASEGVAMEEWDAFKVITDELDARAEQYTRHIPNKKPAVKKESLFHKHNRLGIHGGTWCRVDTEGVFEYNGEKYRIDENEIQYQPIETDYGDLYDMDRILANGGNFYDMNYDEVHVMKCL